MTLWRNVGEGENRNKVGNLTLLPRHLYPKTLYPNALIPQWTVSPQPFYLLSFYSQH